MNENILVYNSAILDPDDKLKQVFIDCKEIILKDSSIEIKLDNELIRQFSSITINEIEFRRVEDE